MIVDKAIIAWIPVWSSNPFFGAELSSRTTYNYVLWNRLRNNRGVNWWLLRQLLLTNRTNPARYSTTWYFGKLSSGTTHSSVHWYSLRRYKGANFWLLRQLLSIKSYLILYPLFLWRIIVRYNPQFSPLEYCQVSESCQFMFVEIVFIDQLNPFPISHL